MQKREVIEEAIRQGQTQKAQEFLAQYEKILKLNATFEWQYVYKIKAVLEMEKSKGLKKSIEYLVKAVSFTVAQWEPEKIHNQLLSVEEVQLLLLLAKQYERCGNVDQAEAILRGLFTCLEKSYTDEEEKVKVKTSKPRG